MPNTLQYAFHPSQRERFRSGDLIKEWANKYPEIFDDIDIELATNQKDYHFFEWLSAILLFESTGYLSLIEKYETKRHERKIDIFRSTASEKIYSYVLENRAGVPDLFVYKPDRSDWFFCEVKGLTDKLHDHQKKAISQLEDIGGKPVIILELREIKL